jgi:hypothetical protein
MTRLRAHFDGNTIVLDEPIPEDLRENTPVEVLILDDRTRALRDFEAYSAEFWSRTIPGGIQPSGRAWRREDLYERGGRDLS